MRRFRQFLCILLLGQQWCGCAPGYARFIDGYRRTDMPELPDYSRPECWAAFPGRHNPSDSVPLPLRNGYRADTSADVFFLHPTTFTDNQDPRWNAGIGDAAINAKTDYSTILYQASAFNEYRVYAPRYRQAHIRAYFSGDTVAAGRALDLAYADIRAAFQYYLDHYNRGRPVIIAAHSQGSTHAERLLKEFFENGPLRQKLVVAYILGMYIPKDYFTGLKLCGDSLETGCFCGWRTLRTGYEPPYVKMEKGQGLVVNPLTWTNSRDAAPRTLNRGAVLKRFNTVHYGLAGTRIHDGLLWIGRLHMPWAFLLLRKNLHAGDINIFYGNIREDLRRRTRLYRQKTGP